jgi:hypothetical protein
MVSSVFVSVQGGKVFHAMSKIAEVCFVPALLPVWSVHAKNSSYTILQLLRCYINGWPKSMCVVSVQ